MSFLLLRFCRKQRKLQQCIFTSTSDSFSVVVKRAKFTGYIINSAKQSCENKKSEHFRTFARFLSQITPPQFLSQRKTDNPNTGIAERENRGLLTDTPNIRSEMRPRLSSHSRHARSRAMHHREQDSSENIREAVIAAKINIIYYLEKKKIRIFRPRRWRKRS